MPSGAVAGCAIHSATTRGAILAFVAALWLVAAPLAQASPASTAMTEAGARGLALGGAQAAGAEGASSAFWNPAGLAWLQGSELLLSHRQLDAGLTRQSGAFALRPKARPALVVALQGELLRMPGAPAREAVRPGRSPHAGYRATLQSAVQLRPEWSFGAALGRYAELPGATTRAQGWVTDAGVQWRHRATRAGLVMRGLALSGEDATDPVFSAGAAQEFASGRVSWSLQLDRIANEYQPATGCEYRASDRVVLRAGARRPPHDSTPIYCGGIGVVHERIRLDYACRAASGAGTEHALSVALGMGGPSLAPDPAWPVRTAQAVEKPPSKRDAQSSPPKTTAPPAAGPGAPAAAVAPRGAVNPTVDRREDRAPSVLPPQKDAIRREAPERAAPRTEKGRKEVGGNKEAQKEVTALRAVTVVAGPYENLESAAADIVALRRAEFHPHVEQRGTQFFVFVQRCASLEQAEAVRARAKALRVKCTFEAE